MNKKTIIAISVAGVAVVSALAILWSRVWNLKEAASIGIIGGADGPTAIFVAGKIGILQVILFLLPIVALLIGIFFIVKKLIQSRNK